MEIGNKVYIYKTRILDELTGAFHREIRAIVQEVLETIMSHFEPD
jgi:hypothetical protein